MPVFMIPEEYYGLTGLARGISQGVAGFQGMVDTKRRREREDFTFNEAKKQAEDAEYQRLVAKYGAGSKEVAAYLQSKGEDPANLLIDPKELQTRRYNSIYQKIEDGTATELEQAEINLLNGLPVLGVEGELDKARTAQQVEELRLQALQDGAQDEKEYREWLKKNGYTPGSIKALETSLGIQMKQEQLKTEKLQQGSIQANTEFTRARTAAEGSERKGFDIVSARQTADRLNKANIRFQGKPFSAELVAMGQAGRLPPAQQYEFERQLAHAELKETQTSYGAQIRDLRETRKKLELDFAKEAGKPEEEQNRTYMAALRRESNELMNRINSLHNEVKELSDRRYAEIDSRFGVGTGEGGGGNNRQGGSTAFAGWTEEQINTAAAGLGSREAIEAQVATGELSPEEGRILTERISNPVKEEVVDVRDLGRDPASASMTKEQMQARIEELTAKILESRAASKNAKGNRPGFSVAAEGRKRAEWAAEIRELRKKLRKQ